MVSGGVGFRACGDGSGYGDGGDGECGRAAAKGKWRVGMGGGGDGGMLDPSVIRQSECEGDLGSVYRFFIGGEKTMMLTANGLKVTAIQSLHLSKELTG